MALVHFGCRECRGRLTADLSLAGRTVPCPHCGVPAAVPAPPPEKSLPAAGAKTLLVKPPSPETPRFLSPQQPQPARPPVRKRNRAAATAAAAPLTDSTGLALLAGIAAVVGKLRAACRPPRRKPYNWLRPGQPCPFGSAAEPPGLTPAGLRRGTGWTRDRQGRIRAT
jgi:hypothetical protein